MLDSNVYEQARKQFQFLVLYIHDGQIHILVIIKYHTYSTFILHIILIFSITYKNDDC